ncbi:transaldolase [Devriesea agamarum]|uniref:transaldolase n=1 Tax=Devriesea agamarum TaxID=472569 RepID=UPI00071DFD48|nr:transaldolase [Devriesea agamarum]
MTHNPRIKALSEAGVSLWLDDLSRHRITSGNLAAFMSDMNIVGVTTNPSIFEAAISQSDDYDDDIAQLASGGATTEQIIEKLTTDDVRAACDLMRPVFERTDGIDGRVSIEVDPRLAHRTEETIAQARHLHSLVDRPNVMIKIPATSEGLPAITAAIAEGISVNVTLIFSLDRYTAVTEAYMAGLEQAAAAGRDLSSIHSVASFFVSRVDTEVDRRLTHIGTDEALGLRGHLGLANAQLAFETFQNVRDCERFKALAAQGARVQRCLWASTGVKDPAYPDTLYVDGLVANPVVNTVPEKTLKAAADHSAFDGTTILDQLSSAHDTISDIESVGVDLDEVWDVLEREGVDKFEVAWEKLLNAVENSSKTFRTNATEKHS